jgi:hypothetical protein
MDLERKSRLCLCPDQTFWDVSVEYRFPIDISIFRWCENTDQKSDEMSMFFVQILFRFGNHSKSIDLEGNSGLCLWTDQIF